MSTILTAGAVSFLSLASLVFAGEPATRPTPLVDADYGQSLPSSGPVTLWWCEAARKVSTTRAAPSQAGAAVSLRAARNEFEAVQLVVRPRQALTGLTCRVLDLTGPGTGRIAADQIQVLRVRYVKVTSPTDTWGEIGAWPDPLPPFDQPIDVAAERNQPIWILVHVPKTAAAGDYTGTIQLQAAGWSAAVPLRVHVWDFALPDVPRTQSAFGFDFGTVCRYHHVKSDDDQRALLAKYLQCFADHRISPYDPVLLDPIEFKYLPDADPPRVDVGFERFDQAMQNAIDRYHVTSFSLRLPGMGGGTFHERHEGELAGYQAGTPKYEAMFASMVRQIEDHLRQKGWLDRAYVYWFDEPEPKDYAFVRAGMERIHKYAPGIRRMLTEQPGDALVGAVDLWCPILDAFDAQRVRQRQTAGEHFWWYVCTGPKQPYCGLFIDRPATDLRVWLWQTWQRQIDGVLIWSTTYWTSSAAFPDALQNPYDDPMSYVSGYSTPAGSKRHWGNGDGRFIYPPESAAGGSPSPNLEPPVTCIRWEMLRDGVEDVDYLHILADRLAAAKSADAALLESARKLLEVPPEITADLTHYTFDPKSIDERRAAVAAMIEKLASPTSAVESGLQTSGANLAPLAQPSTSFVSGHEKLTAINDDFEPGGVNDHSHGAYGNWPRTGTQWVQYAWSQPISTRQIAVYWWDDGRGVRLPQACRLLYWDGQAFVPVRGAVGFGVLGGQFNATTFEEVTTPKLRLEFDGQEKFSTGILEWQVQDSGKSPDFPPLVLTGVDRVVVLGGKTYLSGSVRGLKSDRPVKTEWSKASGPGEVVFADARSPVTTATVSAPGDYVLKLTAGEGALSAFSTLRLRAENPPPARRLDVVYTRRYRLDSPLWNGRAKSLMVNWIPHCIDMINRTDLTEGQGGIDNFVEAGKALRGEPHGRHKGYVFANAWVHQTVESMCLALLVDPRGDAEIIAAQERMKATLEDWIPKILAAQEPDGYLQTAYTLARRDAWPERWSPSHRGDHEGYVAGYFIESAINHYTLTEGKDRRLYDAARKLADCWVANLGPGKRDWFDGHQEMEQALVRFGRFVNDVEGGGRGDAYVQLARYLLDARRGGDEYDQSHLPPIRQYEAVGHAVRAVYNYSAMADIAAETGDVDYMSAVRSLWDNLVNRKYYVTGGVGSGETSEGFGGNYSLPNDAYCESCSSCGLIFFQYKLNLAYHDARYADLYEETMYNALLGATDLEGRTFNYTNPLIGGRRTPWHVCPCCVGNIPRTLLMIPTWTYVRGADGLYVNLFIGSTIQVEQVAGTDVEMVQKTDYPWSGAVTMTINPKMARRFTVYVRVPDRTTSELYTATPKAGGLKSLALNGRPVAPRIDRGYAAITREWQAGDTITLELPMPVQRITADERIEATRGRVALRCGPLIYNVESVDQPDINRPLSAAALATEWRGNLLAGIVAIKGTWADGSPMMAIPHYARLNRSPHTTASMVWINRED